MVSSGAPSKLPAIVFTLNFFRKSERRGRIRNERLCIDVFIVSLMFRWCPEFFVCFSPLFHLFFDLLDVEGKLKGRFYISFVLVSLADYLRLKHFLCSTIVILVLFCLHLSPFQSGSDIVLSINLRSYARPPARPSGTRPVGEPISQSKYSPSVPRRSHWLPFPAAGHFLPTIDREWI